MDKVISLPESLSLVRREWVHGLVSSVTDGLLPRGGRAKACSLLAGWVVDDDLTLAALLGEIAIEDAAARSPRTIAESLVAAGLVDSAATATEIAGHVVAPVVRQVRQRGVPWRRWWDIDGLAFLLVELWTGRSLVSSSPDTVGCQLRTVWKYPEDLLSNSEDPFRLLPPDLLEESETGEAARLLREFVAAGKIKHDPHDLLSGHLPELGGRPDLIEVVRRIRHRDDFIREIQDSGWNADSRRGGFILADLDSWNEGLAEFASALTAYELELLQESRPGVAYRDECLDACRGYFMYSSLLEDSLPPAIGEMGSAVSAPKWTQEHIIVRGARMSHDSIGPYPVWLLTAETNLSVTAVETLGNSGTVYGIGCDISDNGVELVFRLPLADGDPGPAQQVSFYYLLDSVDSAWQLLHLAAVRRVRLVVLSINGDDELLTHGSVILELPDGTPGELEGCAVTALRALVGDDFRSIPVRRATADPEDESRAAFHANEVAKSEELLDDAMIDPPTGVETGEWQAFQEASRDLARARARYLAVETGSCASADLAAEVDRAVEDRQRMREIARANSPAFEKRSWERGLAAALPDENTAFVHLFIKDDILGAAWIARESGNVVFGPIHDGLMVTAGLLAAVESWSRLPSSDPEWNPLLQAILEIVSGHVFQTLFDELRSKHVTRLYLSPTPPLDLLPLHAVPLIVDGMERPLFEALDAIAYVPTMRMLSALSARSDSVATGSLVVAHSGAGIPGVSRIEGVLDESMVLRAIYPDANFMTERDARSGAVLAAMQGCRTIHVASHAHTAEDRWASGLVLQGESFKEAVLSAAVVLADGDLASVDLLVLNACRTGSHRYATGAVQKLRGIEAVFLARGARTVISTLWDMDDLTALVFAALLHASLAKGESPACAYQEIVAYLRKQGWHEQARAEEATYRAEALLDHVMPDWRDAMDAWTQLSPLFWSSFKITGLT